MSSEEGSAFFGKGCFENVRMPSGKEKEDRRDFSKVGTQVLLSKEVVLGHPCIPCVRVTRVVISTRAWERRGGAGMRGRGGRGRDRYKA